MTKSDEELMRRVIELSDHVTDTFDKCGELFNGILTELAQLKERVKMLEKNNDR